MQPDIEAIRSQLERVFTSEGFASSPRTRRFLEHIVEKTLAGEEADLKGYSIGLDVFDRAEDFDPQTDSIVRVQAGRLRKLLKAYYAADGRSDPVRIELPKGSYVPVFSEIVGPPEAATPEDPAVPSTRSWRVNKWGIGALAATALLLSTWALSQFQSEASSDFAEAAKMPTGPSIAVMPFEAVRYQGDANDLADLEAISTGINYQIADKLSRFKHLFVMQGHLSADKQPRPIAQELNAQYYLSGTLRLQDNRALVTAVLTNTDAATIAWSDSYDKRLEGAATMIDLEANIASDVAAALGQPYGAANQSFIAEAENLRGVEMEHYLCLVDFYDYVRRKSEAHHKRTRDCLEQTIAQHRNSSTAWAALSWMYGDEQRNGYNLTGGTPPFERALEAAETAVRADQTNAMAHQYLAVARFAVGDDDGFKEAAKDALRLNPNDPDVLADIGSHLIQVDNSEEGKLLVEKAIAMNPQHPDWYHGSIIVYHFTRGEADTALAHAERYVRDNTVASQTLYVGCLVQAGKLEQAKSEYQEMIQRFPNFRRDYPDLLASLRLPKEMEVQLSDDLRLASE